MKATISAGILVALTGTALAEGHSESDRVAESPSTGVIFSGNAHITTRQKQGIKEATETCGSLNVKLRRGPMTASKNDSSDVAFVELGEGQYAYEAQCTAVVNGSGQNKIAQGNTTITNGAMPTVNLVFEFEDDQSNVIAPPSRQEDRELLTVMGGSSRGDSYFDSKGDDLDRKSRELTILADLGYLTSRGNHQNISALRFTDLGIWSLAASYTPRRRLTVAGKVEALATAPATMELGTLQAAGGSIAYAMSPHVAFDLSGHWRAGIAQTKSVLDGGAGIIWRKQQRKFLKTEVSVGGLAINHRAAAVDGGNRTSALASVSADIQLCWANCSDRFGATWIGFDSTIPVYNSKPNAMVVGSKPNSSLGFHIGSYARVNDSFDLYASLNWINRGDLEVPRSEFGTLSGGFDQVQISMGAVFHFYFDKKTTGHGVDDVMGL
jgi:hypothetical protein